MRRILHTGLVVLLGVWALVSCRRENPVGVEEPPQETPEQIVSGPAQASLYISIRGFGENGSLTKADFVDVPKALHYDWEKTLKDMRVLVFDATDAFDNDGADKATFKPSGARYITLAKPIYMEELGDYVRVDFTLDKPYKSLALVLLANYGSYDDSGLSGKKLDEALTYLSSDAAAVTYNPDQTKYVTGGIPMHGWKVFGSLEGLDWPLNADEAAKRQLKYYKGISTPLTVVGFNTVSELEHYAKQGTGTGAVRDTDRMKLSYALSRLQLRYSKGDPTQLSPDSVNVKEVKLLGYRNKIRVVPSDWISGARKNPFDSVSDAGDLENDPLNAVTFYQISDTVHVAYVPELDSAKIKAALLADPSFVEPSLSVKVEWLRRDETSGQWVVFSYDRSTGVTVNDGINTYTYNNPFWTSWTQFRTVTEKTKEDGVTKVPVGTLYSLVRQYSYEWVATGIDK